MISSVQSLSRIRLCDPTDCSTPGFPVHHQLPELTQTHVHQLVIPSSHLILCRLLLFPHSSLIMVIILQCIQMSNHYIEINIMLYVNYKSIIIIIKDLGLSFSPGQAITGLDDSDLEMELNMYIYTPLWSIMPISSKASFLNILYNICI